MALNDGVNPWIGDQRRRVVAAHEEAIIDKPICHDPVGETEEQKLERKKRREAIGQRYLAGRGAPFILSAQLKGPFDKANGWKNPWLPKEPTPEPQPAPKENLRSLALKKALRDQPSLTGRQRNGSVSSVASTRSHISIGSNSQPQGMAIDRPLIVRQPAAKPNLHGGLKHFLGAVSGGTPASTRKLDRDNLPAQLPPLKRKADVSWLKGADIVKKQRRELPDLPSPTPPSRVNSQDGRQLVTPTNLLDKFRQHSQVGFTGETQTPANKRPVITSSQSQSQSHVDVPTPSQEYIPPFKRQRRSLAASGEDSVLPSEKKLFAKSRLSFANRRSTSNASALTDHAINEEPAKPLAKRVMSLNRAGEAFGNESFKFRRTKRIEDVNAMETVVSSIERADEDEENDANVTLAKDDVETESEDESDDLEAQPIKKPVAVKPVVEKSTIGKLVAKLKSVENVAAEHVHERKDVPASKAAGVVSDRRMRNSRSLPSDSETESPEKARLPPAEEQKIRDSGIAIVPDEPEKPELPTFSHQVTEASGIVEMGSASFSEESRIQMAQHHLTTIQEVTETTGTHGEVSEPTVQTCTTATESLVMDVVQDEMLHDEEADTSMPDFPPSSDDKHDAQDQPAAADATVERAAIAVAEENEFAETTYVQMASGSISTGSAPHVSQPNASQSTAMNTQAIDALKANLLEEDDEDEDMIAPAPETTSGPEVVVDKEVQEVQGSSGQSQYAQRDETTPVPQLAAQTPTASFEEETPSEPTFYSERKQAGRPQISSSEPTNSRPSTMESQPLIASAPRGTSQQSNVVDSSVGKVDESLEPSQYAQRQRPNVQISESEPTNTGTTRTDSQYAAPPAPGSSSQSCHAAEPTVDDILRILRSSQRRDVDSSHERTPTQKSQDNGSAAAGSDADVVPQEQSFKWHAESTQDEASKISSSPPRSQVYSHTESPIKSSQVDALVPSQFQTQPHPHHSSQAQAQAVQGDCSSIPSNTENTGTTTTESLLLQAIAQDMAREDEGGISMTGLTESSHEKNSGQSDSTPKHSLSQRTAASRTEEVQVEKSSNEGQIHSDGPILAPEVLQEPETQSWHISVVEDSTMIDSNNSDVTEDPNIAMLAIVEGARFTSSPTPPSLIPTSVEEAPSAPREDPQMTLSQNPWATGTPKPAISSKKNRKSVAFSDHPSSSSLDDDDLDLPQQTVNLMPSSPPPRISHPPPSQRQSSPPSHHSPPPPPPASAPIFSPPPVWQEPPSTESPFPLIINGLRQNAQHFLTQSSQGMGMANAFLAADQLAQLAPVREEREDTLSPPGKPRMRPPRQQTPPPQSDAAAQKKGQSSAIKQLAAMYPSSDEEMDDDSPVKERQSHGSSSQSQSATFLPQEHYVARNWSPPTKRPVSRVQVSRSPSTITDPYANPWLTQQPAPPSPHQAMELVEEEQEEEDYDELPPFALGNILGMLGDDFGSSVNRMPGGGVDEGVGQVADEMSDLLETWDVEEELTKARGESARGDRDAAGDRRSSARERVGWGRF